MENNQEEKLQEEQVHNPEVNEQVEGNTDNLSEHKTVIQTNRKYFQQAIFKSLSYTKKSAPNQSWST